MTRSSSAASIGCRPSSRIARSRSGGCQVQPSSSRAQLAPAVQQPGAADRRALEPVDDPGRVVGVVDLVGPGDADEQLADAVAQVGVERQRAQRVPEEASAQREDLVGLVGQPVGAGWRASASRAARARSARSSCQERSTARPTRKRSTSSRGSSWAVQASSRAWRAWGSSPGRIGWRARIPCLTALKRDCILSDCRTWVRTDFCALRRFTSARSAVVMVMVAVPFAGCESRGLRHRSGVLGNLVSQRRGVWNLHPPIDYYRKVFARSGTFWDSFQILKKLVGGDPSRLQNAGGVRPAHRRGHALTPWIAGLETVPHGGDCPGCSWILITPLLKLRGRVLISGQINS